MDVDLPHSDSCVMHGNESFVLVKTAMLYIHACHIVALKLFPCGGGGCERYVSVDACGTCPRN